MTGQGPEGDVSKGMSASLLEASVDFANLDIHDSPIRKGKSSPRHVTSEQSGGALESEDSPGIGPSVLNADGLTSSADEADDSTCAICLKRIPLAETAQPVGCDHVYCTCCILHWATFKDKPSCPQCKQPFSSLITFRTLDGELHDSPCQEPVALLKCAEWFRDYVKMKEQKVAAATIAARRQMVEGSVIDESDYVDYARYYQEYDDDEEVEDYYFSSAAGRARVVIGNRRHGPNGYLSSGRMQARPNPPQQSATSSSKGSKAKGKGKATGASSETNDVKTPGPAKSQVATPGRASSSGKKKKPSIRLDSDDESDDCGPSRKPHSVGRRARRSQKKAAADAKVLA